MLLVRGVIFKWSCERVLCVTGGGQWPRGWPGAVSSIKTCSITAEICKCDWTAAIIIIIIIIILVAERGGECTSSVPHSLEEPRVRTEAYALTSAQPIVMVAVRLRGTYKWLLCVTVSALSRVKTNWLLLFREMTTGLFWELCGTHTKLRDWE